MNRTLNVVRMQFVNRYTFVWMPLIILGASWAMSLVIFAMIPFDGPKYGGGSQAPLWYFLALGVAALSYSFPFSQALSITRREFFLGSMLTAAGTAVCLGIVFVIGGAIEQATGGWGLNGYFFYLDWVWGSGPAGAGLFYAVIALLLFVAGFWAATIYRRFGPMGLTISLVGVGAVLVGLFWIITQLDAWEAVGAWMVQLDPLAVAGIALLTTAVLAAGSFLTLRRAVPA